MKADLVMTDHGCLQLWIVPDSDTERTMLELHGRRLGLSKDPTEIGWRGISSPYPDAATGPTTSNIADKLHRAHAELVKRDADKIAAHVTDIKAKSIFCGCGGTFRMQSERGLAICDGCRGEMDGEVYCDRYLAQQARYRAALKEPA